MKYLGDRTVGIAKNSSTRVAHSQYGFGELPSAIGVRNEK